MTTIKEVLKLSTDYLNSRKEAEEVVSTALNCSRLDLYMLFDQPLSDAELQRAREILKRRSKGEPIAYIRGSLDFYECHLQLNPSVLIPRQETEILVDLIAKSDLFKVGVLWDLCCGSGAIGIALKKCSPNISVTLSDLSADALLLAQENARFNEVEVACVQGDFLAPFAGKKCDLLVCNPPYITAEEWEALDKEVKNFEPKIALVGGEDGLDFYRRLAVEAQEYLNDKGVLWLEIGTGQGQRVKELFSGWSKCTLMKDWAGHDRFVKVLKTS